VPRASGPTAVTPTLRPEVTWAPVAGAAGYQVRLDDVARGGSVVFRTGGQDWTPPNDLTSGRAYRVSVRAVNARGRGGWGPAVAFRVATPTPLDAAGTGPAAKSPAPAWTAITGATRYTVDLVDVTTGRRAARESTTQLSWPPTVDLVAGHRYRWRVRAENASGDGAWSVAATFHA